MTKNREPSLELQRQIADSITARNRSNASDVSTASGNADATLPTDTTACGRTGKFATEGGHEAVTEAGNPPLGSKFEYLDHPADIVLHAWGIDIPEALSNLARCMFGYITSLDSITINERQSEEHGTNSTCQGHDLHSLVYSFLDEWLFVFHDTGFVPKEIMISQFRVGVDGWRIVSSGKGEIMDISRHPQGTEVKAITYSGMRVEEKYDRCDVYVTVDI